MTSVREQPGRAMVNASDLVGERSVMANSNARVRRIAGAAVLACAALSVPVLVTMASAGAPVNTATGDCLAWFGSRGDGICMGYSNGNATTIGTPDFGVYGPGYGNAFGITSGPLLPGQTFNRGIAP